MSQKEIALPDYLKDLMDDSNSPDNLISATSSVPRISLKGQKFRLNLEGEEVKRINDSMAVVIMGVEPERGMCKTFYQDGYQPDSSDPPDCSSTDGVSPDSWIANPVSDKCAKCEKNAWGSAVSMSGGKAKACRDSKRLYVCEAKDFQEGPQYLLNVTVASLKSLSAYGKLLSANRVPMAAAITKLVMDDEADHPRLDFEFVGIMKEAMGKASLARSALKEWNDFAAPALEAPTKSKQLSHDDDDEEKESAADKKKRLAKEKKAKIKADAAAALAALEDDDDDEDDKPVKKVKGELVEEDEADAKSPMSDVDDLLDGWDD